MTPPLPSREPPSDLRGQVLGWFIRRQRADWNSADEADFQAWLQADPAHRSGYAAWDSQWRAFDAFTPDEVASLRTGLSIDKAREAARNSRRATGLTAPDTRRRWLAPALAIAVLSISGGFFGWRHWQAQPVYVQAFSTQRGQQIEARLPDGTHLRLDTATRLQVRYYRDRREVRMLEGQTLFSVQSDAQRPFQVQAGAVEVTVVGTRFAVRHTPDTPGADGTRVMVESGKVRVSRLDSTGRAHPEDAAQTAVDLVAGEQVDADRQGALSPVSAVASAGVAPWTGHRISFVDTPLSTALAELERYGNTGLVVRDPSVAAMRLSGTFDPRDAQTLRRVLPIALPVRLQESGSVTELLPARR